MTVASLPVSANRRMSAAPDFADAAAANLDAVHRYLTHLVHDADLAEDLTAATFERAFTRWQRFDPAKGTALTWLITIARRIALDHIRSDRRRRAREARAVAGDPRAVEPPDMRSLSPELTAALGRLSDVEREVVALRVVLDVDGPSVARILGITPTACSTHLHRAMTRLRRELES